MPLSVIIKIYKNKNFFFGERLFGAVFTKFLTLKENKIKDVC